MRSIARVPGCSPRPPFRQTKLTRILEEALAPDDSPSGGGASYSAPKRGSTRGGAPPRQARATVMLINAAPAEHLEKMTTGSLRYGQLFAGSAQQRGGGGSSGGSGGGSRAREQSGRGTVGAAPSAMVTAIAAELAKVFAAHAPEKCDDEAHALQILAKFPGREAKFLSHIKQKYGRE